MRLLTNTFANDFAIDTSHGHTCIWCIGHVHRHAFDWLDTSTNFILIGWFRPQTCCWLIGHIHNPAVHRLGTSTIVRLVEQRHPQTCCWLIRHIHKRAFDSLTTSTETWCCLMRHTHWTVKLIDWAHPHKRGVSWLGTSTEFDIEWLGVSTKMRLVAPTNSQHAFNWLGCRLVGHIHNVILELTNAPCIWKFATSQWITQFATTPW